MGKYVKKNISNRKPVIIGEKFGMLTIVEDLGSRLRFGLWRTAVRCKCDCGADYEGFVYTLKSGGVKSCGCYRKALAKEWGKARLTKHGVSSHALMRVWDAMIQRCTNNRNKHYDNYGGKGVVVCEEWLKNYYSFYEWAIRNGWEAGLQLDKDKKGNGHIYGPETCCFLTSAENNRHKRNNIYLEYNGEKLCLQDWASKLDIPAHRLGYRLKKGWSTEQILFTPKVTKYADRIKKCN